MRPTRILLSLAAVATLGAAPFVLTRSQPRAAAPGEPDGLRDEVSRLRDEVAALGRQKVAPAPVVVQAAAPAPTAAAPAVPAAPALDPDQAAATARVELTARLDREFAADPADPVGAPEVERRIADALAGEAGRGSRLRAAECHRNVCRAEVESDDEEALERLAGGLPEQLALNLQGFVDRDRERPVVTLYVSRGAYRLGESR